MSNRYQATNQVPTRRPRAKLRRNVAAFLVLLCVPLVAAEMNCPGSVANDCVDPEVELPLVAPGAYEGYEPGLDLSGIDTGAYGDRLYFDSSSDGTLRVMTRLEGAVDKRSRTATLEVGEFRIHVEPGTPRPPSPPGEIRDSLTLRSQRDLETLAVVRTWTRTQGANGEPRAALSKVSLVDPQDANAALDQAGLWIIANDPTCEELAFTNVGPLPAAMPPVNLPEIGGCSMYRCYTGLRSYILSHHHVWRAHQMMDFIDSRPAEQSAWMWTRPGRNAQGDKLSADTSPEHWYGDHAGYRFDAIRQSIDKLWNIYKTGKNGGITIKLKCPDAGANPGNICFTVDPSAHHVVKGFVNLCDRFYTEKGPWQRQRIMAHELLHHVFVSWNDGIWKNSAIMDTHYHGHGAGCGLSPKTEKHYGEAKIVHLATYTNDFDNQCSHRDKNFRNNDTHAYFITQIGDDILDGDMTEWPAWGDPTPQPPECEEDGTEDCRCLPLTGWGEGEFPDGDELDEYCPNDTPSDSYEITCQRTKFNASDNVGVCRACHDVRGAGCACDLQNPCDEGFCWGEDTWGPNQGTGHCYQDPPPDFQCLADCDTLYNDDDAWCFNDHYSGQARCMDHLCDEIKEWECFQDGTTCRYGECMPAGECTGAQDCWDLGYPGIYECVGAVCQYPF